ncbi:MAG: hypothetical protein JSS70_13420 [Bacteroidetes bacterium]|nr:hypothetical protein [Bacteroidota bacterium]
MKNVQKILKVTYGVVPVVAGLDKFTNLLTDWKQYVSLSIANLLPVGTTTFMMIIGVIEIIAGILVFARTALGAYIVMAWLIAIALLLIAGGHYYDVAIRDLVMAVGAYVLAQLSGKTNFPG